MSDLVVKENTTSTTAWYTKYLKKGYHSRILCVENQYQ